MNKLPVTIFMKEHIDKIKNTNALGVYAYLISCFQNAGITTSFNRAIGLIIDHFNIHEDKAVAILDYLIELDIGLQEYIIVEK